MKKTSRKHVKPVTVAEIRRRLCVVLDRDARKRGLTRMWKKVK